MSLKNIVSRKTFAADFAHIWVLISMGSQMAS